MDKIWWIAFFVVACILFPAILAIVIVALVMFAAGGSV